MWVKRKVVHVQAERFDPDNFGLPSHVYQRCGDFYLSDDGEFIIPGDYIITDQNGNRSVCKQEDFEKEYEPV